MKQNRTLELKPLQNNTNDELLSVQELQILSLLPNKKLTTSVRKELSPMKIVLLATKILRLADKKKSLELYGVCKELLKRSDEGMTSGEVDNVLNGRDSLIKS